MNEGTAAEQAPDAAALQAQLPACVPLAAMLRVDVTSLTASGIELRCPAPATDLGVAPVLAGLGE